jgi:multiple antibiotic resistance protein
MLASDLLPLLQAVLLIVGALFVGAGAIAVAITLSAHHGQPLVGDAIQLLAARLGEAVIAAALWLVYGFAGRVSGWIGSKGMEVRLRLSALRVLSIGVQIVWNGVKALLGKIRIA